jgi:uncharacterized cofD-like protein
VTSATGPRVVAFGGGHGLSVTLRAVLPWAASVTAVVSTADDGGSTGRLRESWEVPALGDVRRCLAALGGSEALWPRVLEHRFEAGELEGHALGNLLLLALTEQLGDLQAACDEIARTAGIDGVRARVVPVTDDAVVLHGRTAGGEVVVGQVAVAETDGIEEVWVDPACTAASPVALRAVAEADLVALGPGSLYTSVLAAAVVGDLRKALGDTSARLVYVGNLRPDGAETRGYDLAGHVAALRRHGIHPDLLVAGRGTLPVGDPGIDVVEADLAAEAGGAHDPERLGAVLAGVLGRAAHPG